MNARKLYLIDGVAVPRRVYVRRQIWGEHSGARFQIVETKNQAQ